MATSTGCGRGRGKAMAASAVAALVLGAGVAEAQHMAPPGGAASSSGIGPDTAAAAAAGGQPAAADAQPGTNGLGEIVVTAQRREQRLQDVPIAITAINQATLAANRVQTVQDLSGLAPNLVVRQSAGSNGIPSFTMRGITSYGVVPGSDKEISIYIDGVYIGSPRGSIFNLPDISRIEVLRGPQGTLFGRNATAGAISVTTRDPTGTFGGRQEVSFGNYDYLRTRTTVDTPQFGPFSAYATFMHDARRGDIRNLGAGTAWDRTASATGRGVLTSPKYLGDKDANSVFVALKFEPSDSFRSVYKFDYSTDHFTPEGVAVIATNPAALGPAAGGFLGAILAASPGLTVNPGTKRPDAVNNSWSTPAFQRVQGHSLTSNLELTDHFALKNIASYRKTFVTVNAQLDGLGGLVYPFPPIAGAPFVATVGQNQATDRQASDELQANYSSRLLTLTVGGLYFWQKSLVGPFDIAATPAFTVYPGGVIPRGNISASRIRSTSVAAYGQAEVHVTSRLDLVGGVRVTRDHKSGTFFSSGAYANGVYEDYQVQPFDYKKTKPSYSVGVNYKATPTILLYGKYSTAFVSGGSVGGVLFAPEEANSWEAGVKADLLDRRLRANLALFTTRYTDVQSAQSGINVGRPDLPTVVISLGDERARGAELELTAAPVAGVTLTASGGYTDADYHHLTPTILAYGQGDYSPTLLPKFTATLSGQYQTGPVVGQSPLLFRIDANWRDRMLNLSNGQVAQSPAFAVLKYVPSAWIVNGRVALQKIKLGPVNGDVALWGRNLFNDRTSTYPLNFGGYVYSSTFQRARTYGADLSVAF